MYSNKPKKEVFVSINKLIVLGAAFILASLIGSTPAAAVTPQCDPLVIAADPNGDCDGDLIPNFQDTCDNRDTSLDCDGDGVFDDECPYTVLGEDLVVGACTIPGLDFIYPEGSGPAAGCSLTELLDAGIDNCADGAKNHGKYVSCVSHLTNFYKKQKLLTGAQKGLIQSCAAQTDIGKKPHP
jgi:hypothetical protein